MEKRDVLAQFFNMKPSDLQEWSDGTFTPITRDDIEYIALDEKEEDHSFTRYFGQHQGYYIYQN